MHDPRRPLLFVEAFAESLRTGHGFRHAGWHPTAYARAVHPHSGSGPGYIMICDDPDDETDPCHKLSVGEATERIWYLESDELFQARRTMENAVAHVRQLRDKAEQQAREAAERMSPQAAGNARSH